MTAPSVNRIGLIILAFQALHPLTAHTWRSSHIPVHDRLELDFVFVVTDPSLLRLLLQAPFDVYFAQAQEGLDWDTLGTFGICTFLEDSTVHSIVDILHIFQNHWVHLRHHMLLKFTFGLEGVAAEDVERVGHL